MPTPAVTLIAAVLLLTASAGAQSDEPAARRARLALLARAEGDSVVLRWGVSTPGGWIVANRLGYVVERLEVPQDSTVRAGAFMPVTPSPLRPWTREQWQSRMPRPGRFAAVAIQSLYGTSDVPGAAEGPVRALKLAADDLSNRWGFAHFAADNDITAAEGLALRWVDTDVRRGSSYLYRLRTAGVDTTYALDTATVLVEVVPLRPSPPPQGVTAEGGDREIRLFWTSPPGVPYSGFYIDRAEAGSGGFVRITEVPVVLTAPDASARGNPPAYIDTTAVNYTRYRYRIIGITPFSDLGEPAEVEAVARDRTPPPAPLVRNPQQISGTALRLEWEMPQMPGDLAGFVVARGKQSLEGYRDLHDGVLPPATRAFVDTAASAREPYYIIGAVDTAGNVAPSLPVYADLLDTIPPSTPTGLRGTIDTNGVVRLVWDLGPEENLLGYRVLWSNAPDHEFSPRVGEVVRDTVFADTITVTTLTPSIYYRIAAVNMRYQHSPPTAMIGLRRPDKNPPSPSIFTDFLVSDSTVFLRWAVSSSADLREQHIYRRREDSTVWVLRATLGPADDSFTDRAVVRRRMYEYRLEAEDSAGLRSAARTLAARPYDSGVRPEASALTALHDSVTRSTALEWSFTAPLNERFWFVVYRSKDGGVLQSLRAVASTERRFVDRELIGPGRYEYAVLVKSPYGQSPLSATVAVVVP